MCHLLNLAIKAIALLPEFEQIIHQIRGILAFMSRSSYAMEHFDHKRHELGIARGLEAIGDTWFGTLYWAGRSIQRCLPALQAIVEDEQLGISIHQQTNPQLSRTVQSWTGFQLSQLSTATYPTG